VGLITLHAHPRANRASAHGFTLIELLVVLVIAGIMLGLVALNTIPNKQQSLKNDAQRIAHLLQLARDEAILRNRLIAFETANNHYRFLIYDQQQWQPIGNDEILRERTFRDVAVTVTVVPAITAEAGALRIVFGREPVDKPFVLTLTTETANASIRADGIGHFETD
jgi:general secretion pathway protein H